MPARLEEVQRELALARRPRGVDQSIWNEAGRSPYC